MEKISPKWLKKFLAILLSIAIFSLLSMQIFADFAGDGTISPGNRIYSQSGVDSITIQQMAGGSSSEIDSLVYSPIPLFENGTLTSEVSRGVYGALSGQFYRYTTEILRHQDDTTVTEKVTFDAPLFNTATELAVTFHIPIVRDPFFDFRFNIVTNNTASTAYINFISVRYQEKLLLHDEILEDDGSTTINYYSESEYITQTFNDITYSTPYNFEFMDYTVDDIGGNLYSDVYITFHITLNQSGTISFSYVDEYAVGFGFLPEFHSSATVGTEIVYLSQIPFAESIVNSFSDLAEIELFGAFSIGDILWAFIGIGVTIAFIKLFAGG